MATRFRMCLEGHGIGKVEFSMDAGATWTELPMVFDVRVEAHAGSIPKVTASCWASGGLEVVLAKADLVVRPHEPLPSNVQTSAPEPTPIPGPGRQRPPG